MKRLLIKQIKNRINLLSNEFVTNIENHEIITLTYCDLVGLSNDYLNLWCIDDKYSVALNHENYVIIMSSCSNRKTRKLIMHTYYNQYVDTNTSIIKEILTLRHKLANLFGYDSFSAYMLRNNMITEPDDVHKFLTTLKDKMKPLLEKDYAELLQLARKDAIVILKPYDIVFYRTIKNKCTQQYYFNPTEVIAGLFTIFGSFLNLKFVNVTKDFSEMAWNSTVEIYLINDYKYLIFDIYSETTINCCQCGITNDNIPVIIISCNFKRNWSISIIGVKILFHEFGHAMHHIMMNYNYDITPDAVEIPSILFEEWIYSPDVLKIINRLLTNFDIHTIITNRKSMSSCFIYNHLILSLFDNVIHSTEVDDYNNLYATLHKDVTGITLSNKYNVICSFIFIMKGYEATYYTYLYSAAISKYLYQNKFMGNEMNPIIGKEYVCKLLDIDRNFKDSLTEYLGFYPNNEELCYKLLMIENVICGHNYNYNYDCEDLITSYFN